MREFEKVVPTACDGQKGVDVHFAADGKKASINVWIDVLEPDDTRIFVSLNGDERLLCVGVGDEEFGFPEISFEAYESESYCYLTFGRHQVHVALKGEGFVVDVWYFDGSGSSEVIDSAYEFYTDLS